MTGIERLRELTEARPSLLTCDQIEELRDISAQIAREHAEDCHRMGLDYGTVLSVAADMERHFPCVERGEESDVERWSRELRGALGGRAQSHAADVSMSAYDLLPEEDRESIAWVREHGGLENVRDAWDEAVNLCATIGCEPNDESEMLQALGDCTDIVIKRLMPEGLEWPRYDASEPVRISGAIADELGCEHVVTSVELHDDGADLHWNPAEPEECVWVGHGEPVRRPVVPAADGEPLEVGQTVWRIDTGAEYWVKSGQTITSDAVVIIRKTGCDCESEIVKASQLTHQRPVLDADGVPIKKGDTVYGTVGGGPFIVTEVSDKGSVFVDAFPDTGMHGSMFTHTKPERDSWERIEEDARGLDSGVDSELFSHTHEDLVRRCRALAERERGE